MKYIALLGLLLLSYVCCATTSAAQPHARPPILANQFIAHNDRSIPDEGAAYLQETHFDNIRGAMLVNKSTPNGWYASLMIVNHTNATDGRYYMFYPIDGQVTCYAFHEPVTEIPIPQFPPTMSFARKGRRGGMDRSVFRTTVGKYVLTLMTGSSGFNNATSIAASWMDHLGMGNTEDATIQNKAVPSADRFVVPPECENPTILGSVGEPHFKAERRNFMNIGNDRATPRLYGFKTRADFMQQHATKQWRVDEEVFTLTNEAVDSLPQTIDNRRFATPIRNQGMCGACWAFSSVAAAEIAFNMVNNITSVETRSSSWGSVQNLIDCVHGDLNGTAIMYTRGCLGGCPRTAMHYMVQHGLARDVDYSFDGVTGSNCRQRATAKNDVMSPIVKALYIPPGYYKNPAQQTTAFMAALAQHGAFAAIINVLPDFEFYGGGVYDNPNCKPGLHHAVTVVGYSTQEADDGGTKLDYWLVKNSFGGNWGDQGGYFKMRRGVNMCGIEDFAFIPVGRSNTT